MNKMLRHLIPLFEAMLQKKDLHKLTKDVDTQLSSRRTVIGVIANSLDGYARPCIEAPRIADLLLRPIQTTRMGIVVLEVVTGGKISQTRTNMIQNNHQVFALIIFSPIS